MPAPRGNPVRRVLIVAMADSIHTARWLEQLQNEALEIELFPSTPHRRVHELIKNACSPSGTMQLRISPTMSWAALPLGLVDLLCRGSLRAMLLRRRLRTFDPEIVHALECQHAGYLTDKALRRNMSDRSFQIILSLWGSDLFWYQQFRRHRRALMRLLSRVSLLVVECSRDIEIAERLGYRGAAPVLVPASGGVWQWNLKKREPRHEWSRRRTVAVKGYGGRIGKGPSAIRVLGSLASTLQGFTVEVFAASASTRFVAWRVRRATGLSIVTHRKHSLRQDEMNQLWERTRIFFANSRSDGIPASAKEAFLAGAVVVHSNTSCLKEHVEESGLLEFAPSDLDSARRLLSTLLINDSECYRRAFRGGQQFVERFEWTSVARVARSIYRPGMLT